MLITGAFPLIIKSHLLTLLTRKRWQTRAYWIWEEGERKRRGGLVASCFGFSRTVVYFPFSRLLRLLIFPRIKAHSRRKIIQHFIPTQVSMSLVRMCLLRTCGKCCKLKIWGDEITPNVVPNKLSLLKLLSIGKLRRLERKEQLFNYIMISST